MNAPQPAPLDDAMVARRYPVRFLTPAFLGNADQKGQWRTPPFRHLLREWWRVAWVAAGGNPGDVAAMRSEEARLFGAAAGEQGRRSLIRMRLEHWSEGRLKHWKTIGYVQHPEVGHAGGAIGADLYLGYGPLVFERKPRGTRLKDKANAAIQAGETNVLKLACPESDLALVETTLALIHAFGTLGGRSRNGWGSVLLEGIEEGRWPLRDWQACLDCEWAHAIGMDDSGPLVWRTQAFEDWKEVMTELARIKVGLRTRFRFRSGNKAPAPEDRHWLSYPVTHHSVTDWNNLRLPNSLRFKVRRDDASGGFYGMIFHMPCKPPQAFRPSTGTLSRIWEAAHRYLDEQSNLQRNPS